MRGIAANSFRSVGIAGAKLYIKWEVVRGLLLRTLFVPDIGIDVSSLGVPWEVGGISL